jgi:hypothetical protein
VTRYEPVERRAGLDYDALIREHLRPGRPVILTDLTQDWPALARWTPEFFRTNYGERRVAIYDESFQAPGRNYLSPCGSMQLGEYLDVISRGPTRTRLFLFDLFRMAPELRGDIVIPAWGDLITRRYPLGFFGGAGGVTTFHYDVDLPHVFHAVIHGEKEFYLFGPEQTPHLYRHPFTVRSYVDAKHPDLARYPAFARARGQACTVRAGETLVIPAGHWHQVHYPGPSWGVALRKYDAARVPRGLYNMLIQEGIDRALTLAAPTRWFAFKDERARRGAA